MTEIKPPDFEREANAYSYDDRGGTRIMKASSGAKLARAMYAKALSDVTEFLSAEHVDWGVFMQIVQLAEEVEKGL